jgi:DNA-binding NarL/FixJ family response regulator
MPNCKIILLTMFTEFLKIKTIINTINPSWVIKNDLTFDELIYAFNKIINNEQYYSDSVLKCLRNLKKEV